MTLSTDEGVRDLLRWCVEHDGECLGDHQAILEQARAALAANSCDHQQQTLVANGYAVVMQDGWFVGIWRDRETAEIVAGKHPHGEVKPMVWA